MTPQSSRIAWIDSLRFIAIFLVYVGHLGPTSGRIYDFVYLFHVPLFFFIAGLFHKKNRSVSDSIKSGFNKLIVPYFVYSILSIAVYALFLNKQNVDIISYVKDVFLAKRNHTIYANQLWFLPCIYLVSIVYSAIRKIISKESFILIICFAMMSASVCFPDMPVSIRPKAAFGADSAVYYIFWYALGCFCRENFIIFFDKKSILRSAIETGAGAFAIFVFLGGGAFIYAGLTGVFGLKGYVIVWSLPIAVLFISMIPVARYLSRFQAINYLGGATLFLCCIEQIAKTTFATASGVFGLTINTSNEYYSFVYVVIIFSVIYFFIKLTRKDTPR